MINIHVVNNVNHDLKLNFRVIENCCREVMKDNKHDRGDVTLIFTDDESLLKMKNEFFQEDVFTDVITFNLEDEETPIEGEIYISWDRVKDNAEKFEQSKKDELKRVIIHGTLHLVGFDDQTDDEKNEMTCLEDKYISQISGFVIA